MPHGELFRLLRRTGFAVVDLVGLHPPEDAVDHACCDSFSVQWARQWPGEEICVAEKMPSPGPTRQPAAAASWTAHGLEALTTA